MLHCGCGNYGCLEAYTSGPAIATIGEMCEYDLNRITPELIAKAAQAGELLLGPIRRTLRERVTVMSSIRWKLYHRNSETKPASSHRCGLPGSACLVKKCEETCWK